MKNIFLLVRLIGLTTMLCCLSMNVFAQGQLKKWYLNGQEIDFSILTAPPVVNGLPSELSGSDPKLASNGIYDQNGNLLFYIVKNTLFSKNGTIIENLLSESSQSGEIGVVAVPGSSCKFYVIYSNNVTASNGDDVSSLYYSEIDMSLNGNAGGISPNKHNILIKEVEDSFSWEIGIAISPLKTGNIHYLYVVHGNSEFVGPGFNSKRGSAEKFIINANGISTNSTLLREIVSTNINDAWVCPELELSHDGSMLAFTSIIGGLVILHLDPSTGNLNSSVGDNGLSTFSIEDVATGNHDWIMGLEFTSDNQSIFLSARTTGIHKVNLINETSELLPNTQAYDHSSIELAHNGFMYVVKSNTEIGRIDLTNNSVVGNAISGLNGTSIISSASSTFPQFILPDQIDGFDYDDFFQNISKECCSALSTFEISTIDVEASDSWTDLDNPFNNNDVIRVQTELRVSNNSHLTLKNLEFLFAEGARVVVEVGSKLTVDNTTLTANDCETVWEGIQVWGNSAASQSTPGAQGVLTLKNTSLIEHAHTAVRLYSTEVACCTNGGLLYASGDTDFKNNYIGIEFRPYVNFTPSTNAHQINFSYISNCNFTINNDYRFSDPMNGHIRLEGVDGISIRDNSFKSEQSNAPTGAPVTVRGFAIRSINAAFRLTSTCTVSVPVPPCPAWNSNSFSGFFRAIWASSSNGGNPFGAYHIDRAHFEKNLTSIYNQGVNNGLIIRSTFEVGNFDFPMTTNLAHRGIYLYSGTSYKIEQNTMTEVGSSSSTYGIQAANTGASNNQIRKNSFTGFLRANYSTGQNRESQDVNDPDGVDGLRYFCNTNSQNVSDFEIQATQLHHGVATNQGIMSNSISDPALQSAANTFSHVTWDFRNFNVLEPVQYWGHSSDISQPSLIPLLMQYAFYNDDAQAANGCASTYTEGDEKILAPQELADLTTAYNNHKIETGNLEAQLALNKDDGDTQATVGMITNWRDSGQSLKTTLNGISPYLSQAALFAAFDRSDIFTNQDRYDIFLANPDELRRATTIQYAEQGSNPLPQAMINSLKTAAQQNFTVRSELVGKIEGRKAAMGAIADRVLLSISEDCENFNYTVYRDWLNRKGGFETQLAIIESHITEGNLTQAVALLDDMEQNGNLNSVNQGIFDNFRSIKELEMLLISENRSWAALDTPEILQLEVIANSDFALATAQAQGILSFFYDYSFETDFEGFNQANPNSDYGINESTVGSALTIHTYPTPAKEQITFQLESPLNSNTMLTITDVNGKMVSSSLLQEGGLQFDIPTTSLPVGMFYYQVVINGENKTGKIVITR